MENYDYYINLTVYPDIESEYDITLKQNIETLEEAKAIAEKLVEQYNIIDWYKCTLYIGKRTFDEDDNTLDYTQVWSKDCVYIDNNDELKNNNEQDE